MSRLPPAGAFLAALLATACGARLAKLPDGPGAPAPDAAQALAEATAACRALTSISAELSVSGAANGQRLRGRVLAGLAAPSSAYLDAAAPFGASLFIYAARGASATLLLPRDRRVLEHGDPAGVLEAVTGVPLGAAELRTTLTGCVDGTGGAGRSFGDAWRAVALPSGEAYLRRGDGSTAWRLVAVTHGGTRPADGWRSDFAEFVDGLPRTVRLVSGDGGRRFNIRLALSQFERNPSLGDEIFDVRVPAGTTPITLDDLRRSGPLGDTRGGAGGP